MRFTSPTSFAEALEAREVRDLLPTELRSELLSQIEPQVLERAMFSAGITKAELLQEADQLIEDILQGRVGRAEARLELRRGAEKLGYGRTPDLQEAVDRLGDEGLGGVTDLLSDHRMNLILDTNVSMARGYGYHKQGQRREVLDAWPAAELVRARIAREPRDWPARWVANGGTLRQGRMVARKDSDIWVKISAFGLPYEPFDYGSGMVKRDVRRDVAIRLGVIDESAAVQPDERNFNEDLQASPRIRNDRLRAALESTGLGRFDSQGVFRKA